VKTAMQVLAACEASGPGAQDGVAVLRLTLNGFDTHQNQPGSTLRCSSSSRKG
jgi:uncharacterized protein (DUF1501 family)